MFVGTFRNLISTEEFKERDEVLKKTMECTDFYDKGIIEYATEEQITLPMNNMSDTKEEIDRQTFENCIKKNLGKVHIPCT